MRLLVVEDEVKMAHSLERGLKAEGYVVDVAFDSDAAQVMLQSNTYDALLLDWMIPGELDGPALIKQLRDQKKHVPVILLTARTAVGDRVHGLDAGADDYLGKPFSFDELLARVRALLRRPRPTSDSIQTIGSLSIDSVSKTATFDGRPLALTAKEFRLVEYLLSRRGEVVSKDQILDHVWDDEERVQRNTVETFIANIRRKLGTADDTIQTVRGYGYKVG